MGQLNLRNLLIFVDDYLLFGPSSVSHVLVQLISHEEVLLCCWYIGVTWWDYHKTHEPECLYQLCCNGKMEILKKNKYKVEIFG